jgi:hypothetical protein
VKTRLLALALITYLLAVFCFRPHATPGPQLRDFEAYYAAGQTWSAGGNPYEREIWSAERTVPGVDPERAELLPFINPPPLLPVLALYARAPFSIAAIAWSVTLGAALLATLGTLLALLGRIREPLSWMVVIVGAIAFGPISSDLALGQFALIGVAAVAVASLAFLRGATLRASAATIVAGLAPTLSPVLLAWSRNRNELVAQAAGAGIFLAVWMLLARAGNVPTVTEYLQLLQAHGSAEGLTLIQFTPAAIAHGFGASDAWAAAAQTIVAIAAVIAAVAIAYLRRTDPIAVFCSFCALAPLALGFFHEHDFALLFIPAFVLLARCARTGAMRGWSLAAILLVGIDWLGIAQRPDGTLQTIAIAIALIASVLAFSGTAQWRDLFPSLGALAAILAAGALARGHALPIWPDAMTPFAIAASASVAQMWHAEQQAAGMFEPSVLASALRCLPLLGCALLACLSAFAPKAVPDSKTP